MRSKAGHVIASLEALLGPGSAHMPSSVSYASAEFEPWGRTIPLPQTPPLCMGIEEPQVSRAKRESRSRSPRGSRGAKTSRSTLATCCDELPPHAWSKGSIPWLMLVEDHFGPIREQRFAEGGLVYVPIQESIGVGMGTCTVIPSVPHKHLVLIVVHNVHSLIM